MGARHLALHTWMQLGMETNRTELERLHRALDVMLRDPTSILRRPDEKLTVRSFLRGLRWQDIDDPIVDGRVQAAKVLDLDDERKRQDAERAAKEFAEREIVLRQRWAVVFPDRLFPRTETGEANLFVADREIDAWEKAHPPEGHPA